MFSSSSSSIYRWMIDKWLLVIRKIGSIKLLTRNAIYNVIGEK